MELLIKKEQMVLMPIVLLFLLYAAFFLTGVQIGGVILYDKILHFGFAYMVTVAILLAVKDETGLIAAFVITIGMELYRSPFMTGGVSGIDNEIKNTDELYDFVASFFGILFGWFVYEKQK
ncbi:hypothetical protein LCGC14_0303110 [marine sediment metagenome]|uniref:Uncharacterized protein n=1 Tax=marine sediment metagenome TaxID=412755 RepID=A0A0F9TPP9_9ZZZZ